MAEPNIVLARLIIDLYMDKLVMHGLEQVKQNLIVVADDECSHDEVQKSVMKMTADSVGIGIRFFFSLQKQ